MNAHHAERSSGRTEPTESRAPIRAPKPPRSHRIVVYFVSPHVMVRTMGVWNHRPSAAEAVAVRDLRDEPRCERSWRRDETVRQRSDGGWLSDRDAEAVGVA